METDKILFLFGYNPYKNCKKCGGQFIPKTCRNYFCSSRCGNAFSSLANYRRHNPLGIRRCFFCQKTFSQHLLTQKYCTAKCRDTSYIIRARKKKEPIRECYCGQTFRPCSVIQKCCSRKCTRNKSSRLYKARKRAGIVRNRNAICKAEDCRKPFIMCNGFHKFCSKKCQRRHKCRQAWRRVKARIAENKMDREAKIGSKGSKTRDRLEVQGNRKEGGSERSQEPSCSSGSSWPQGARSEGNDALL